MSNFQIIEEKVENNTLTIKAKIKLKNLASDPKVRIKTRHILQAVENKYLIEHIIQHNEICNFVHGGKVQTGTWIFKIDNQPKQEATKPKTRSSRKPATKGKSTPSKNTSTKASIRGRMSKIAKDKQVENE